METMDFWWSESTVQYVLYTVLEVCRVWVFPLLLRSCISKLDSCSWSELSMDRIRILTGYLCVCIKFDFVQACGSG